MSSPISLPNPFSSIFPTNEDKQGTNQDFRCQAQFKKPPQSMIRAITFESLSSIEDEPTSTFEVEVSYKFVKSKQLAEEIRQVVNPQVIFWYMGVYGLREQGVRYYRKDLTKILKLSTATCQLYDLTAWAPFNSKNSEGTLQDFNKNADLINQFAITRIGCLKSCDFFDWLMKVEKGGKMEKLKKIFQRPFIYQLSQSFSQTVRTIGTIFKDRCPVIEELYERDASTCYSALQYIEGIYLVQTLVKKALLQEPDSKEVNLVFALPNNEYCYYQDEENSLAQDVKAILQDECGDLLSSKRVNVMFYNFEFGKGGFNRPYNAGSKNIEQLRDASEIVDLSKLKDNVRK
jgi:hypothetical protein